MYDNLFFFLSFSQGLCNNSVNYVTQINSNIFFYILSQMDPKGF